MGRKVAIIGAGPAGASTAILLFKQGFEVTVFESQSDPGPVGAGIMMQPTGLSVLKEVGVYDSVMNASSAVKGIRGVNSQGRSVLQMGFDGHYTGQVGRGVHRGSLFMALYSKLKELGINVKSGHRVSAINQNNGKGTIKSEGQTFDGFDLVIVASGRDTRLLKNHGIVAVSREQRAAAIWAVLPYEGGDAQDEKIFHVYKGTNRMYGTMPVGKGANGEGNWINFFCGLPTAEMKEFGPSQFEAWKKRALIEAPQLKHLLVKLTSSEDFVKAPYYDVRLKTAYKGCIVAVGDSFHALSPHLSAGTNLALVDARQLAESLEKESSIPYALERYKKLRTSQIGFYYWASRMITPIFQSGWPVAWVKSLLQLSYKIPFFRKFMQDTILGVRNGWTTRLGEKYIK